MVQEKILINLFERLINQYSSDELAMGNPFPELQNEWQLLRLIDCGKLEECEALALELWHAENCNLRKGFVLYLAIMNCEIAANYSRRREWVVRRLKLDIFESPYLQAMTIYHDALEAYFNNYLVEAAQKFTRCANMSHEVGLDYFVMRSNFHLGLICEIQGNQSFMKSYLDLAKSLAIKLRAKEWVNRIDSQILKTDDLGRRIQSTILKKEISSARTALAERRRLNQQMRRGRRFASLIKYMPLILYARGRANGALRCLFSIRDAAVQLEAVQLCIGAGYSNVAVLSIQKQIASSLHTRKLQINSMLVMSEIKSLDVRKLVKLLLDRGEEGIQIEEISQFVWSLPYNPFLHENKVHKLVSKARRMLTKSPMTIENLYGGYRLTSKPSDGLGAENY